MKKHLTPWKVLVVLAVCLLGIASSSSLSSQPTNPQSRMSKKELKWLIQNAKTTADHQKLAAYYRSQAEHLMKESRKHQELAEAYANRTIFEPKTGDPGGLLAHCREFAALEAKAAKEAQQMAAIHEEMAKESPN